ncbi:MAG: hypothetical protein HN392_00840 [Anaerolineae bacterium]|nr:hypothetical protein [Anaerolineae bacterium]MBT7075130.1 hypothetical protein [Anaerolineae bacterium]MBT7782219.1 hypothetical protein [Anaerolineae bacterium]
MPTFTRKSIPALFALLTILAYGLLIPWLGFYWDDWPFAWIGEFLGPTEFFPAFRSIRPFIAPIFTFTTSIILPSPIIWQIAGLGFRFLSAFAAWWALKQIWQKKPAQTLSVVLLFLLFPGYSQQWVALTHINQEWISLISYLFSFGLTAQALRQSDRSKSKTILSLFLLFWGLYPTEYFLTMEPLRFLIIYFILGEESTRFWPRIQESLKRWLPYFFLWLSNAIWLAYFYTKGTYNSYNVVANQNSTSMFSKVFYEIWDLFYKSLWQIWTRIIQHIWESPSAPTSILGLGLVIFTFVLLIIYLQNLDLADSSKVKDSWASQAIFIGTVGILLGRIPSWMAGLPFKIGTTFDRLTISIMLGTALLLAGILELLIRNEKWRNILLSVFLALAVGQQFLSANEFRRDWERQRNLAWQLSWRIPDMEEGTALMTHELPMVYESDQSFTAPLNWIYAPDYRAGELLPYAFVNIEKRLGGSTIEVLDFDMPINVPYRTVRFEGNTSEAIVIYAPKSGCLRVLDSTYANAEVYKKESHFLTDAIFLSNPAQVKVDTESPTLPIKLFGKEPAHEWCYYSTKAELARQRGDWGEVVRLGDEAEKLGYYPFDAIEWLPFVEGYAQAGEFEKAEGLTEIALKKEPHLRKALCELWARVGMISGQEKAQNTQELLNCTP